MRNEKNAWKSITVVAVVLTVLAIAMVGTASAKSLYLIANHHTKQFDAWNINPDGTASYQFKVNLAYASSPSDIAIDESSNVMFITSEGGTTVEMVDASTMTLLGDIIPVGATTNNGGIEADDANDIVYMMQRGSPQLYAFDWNPSTSNLTLKAGYPKTLAGGGYGIALDETAGILWVADASNGVARAYRTSDWTEDTSKSFTPSHKPVDIAVDRQRGFVYTVSMTAGAGTPPGTGSTLLSKYDLATGTETTINLTDQGVGVAVDEATYPDGHGGYVYVTISPYGQGTGVTAPVGLEVWDTSTSPWTQVQTANVSGSPAGICIPQEEVVFNPLNLTKDDGLFGKCVNPGDSITYTICYDNLRNPDVHNVTLVDDLPTAVSFVSATDGGTYDSVTHTVTWDIGTIPAGTPQQCVQLVVNVGTTVIPGTNITNSVTISGKEPGITGPTTVNSVTCTVLPTPTPWRPEAAAVPALTPIGLIALAGLLSVIAAISIGIRKKR